MKKIAFFEVRPWEEKVIKKAAKKLKADVYPQEVEEDLKRAAEYEIISTFIYSDLSRKTLEKLPKLRFLATRSTGFDHIDIKFCQQKGILVANVPFYGENSVAEYTFGLILCLTRRIVEAVQRVRQGSFSPVGLTGTDLAGKTLGVIGVGRIGSHMVRYAQAFGMKVLGVTSQPHPEREKALGYTRVPLETCLENSDIVTLHVPLTPQTFHLINRTNIKLMKKGSFLVNTSRGPVVETEAVLWALEKGILAGAALDVLEEEERLDKPWALFDPYLSRDELRELVAAHLLREKPNVLITPHNAFNSTQAIKRIVETTVQNIKAFLKGKPINIVNQ